jgi:hypothetical protein
VSPWFILLVFHHRGTMTQRVRKLFSSDFLCVSVSSWFILLVFHHRGTMTQRLGKFFLLIFLCVSVSSWFILLVFHHRGTMAQRVRKLFSSDFPPCLCVFVVYSFSLTGLVVYSFP